MKKIASKNTSSPTRSRRMRRETGDRATPCLLTAALLADFDDLRLALTRRTSRCRAFPTVLESKPSRCAKRSIRPADE